MEKISSQVKKRSFNLSSQGKVRLRFAPAPTGKLHLGGVRTALFNYIYARQNNGSFVLRVEDTDRERFKEEFEKDILEGLRWLGLDWDEGPLFPQKNSERYVGNFGPYRQSERGHIYQKYITKLLNEDKAYRCFCSKDDLESQKQEQMSRGRIARYNGICSQISSEKAESLQKEGRKFVVRLRISPKKVIFNDSVRGDIETDLRTIGDIVIAKGLDIPLYNLAVVIDDFEMKITHIIRGEDHIPNTPKQIAIAEALELPRPLYVHLPLVLGTDRSKLSKRHGAVSVAEYKETGYLPEAMVNVLAFLGWNPGTEKEIYPLASLIKDFSLEKIQKSGAIFNIKKLDFLNFFYLRSKSIEKLSELCLPYLLGAGLIEEIGGESFKRYRLKESGEEVSLEFIQGAIILHQERIRVLSDIPGLTDFIFKDNIDYKKESLLWKEMTLEELIVSLDIIETMLSKIEEKDWRQEKLKECLMPAAEKLNNRGALLWPLRVALTGKLASVGPFEAAEILGKKRTLQRIKIAKEKI